MQFSFSDWYQDYPAASDFLNILLGCDSFHPNSNSSPNIAGFCSKPIQSKMDQAATTGITNPSAANTTWAEVDRDVTDQAPWVSMFNPKNIDFLSSRVKGYQFSPQWYFLLDQASVESRGSARLNSRTSRRTSSASRRVNKKSQGGPHGASPCGASCATRSLSRLSSSSC